MSKEIDTVETFSAVTKFTRKLEKMAGRIDQKTMSELMDRRNPVKSLEYLYDTLLQDAD